MSSDAIQQKLLGLLAAGVPQTAAAAAVGVSPAYVSQLLDDAQFKLALMEASAGKIQQALDHDDTVETLEQKLLNVIQQKLPFIRNPMEAAKIFQILNNSKRRLQGADSQQTPAGITNVTIVLPKAAAASIKLNGANQVIEVEGRTMAPLPSRELPKLQEADAARATVVLDNTSPMHTRIGGVDRVL